MYKLQKFQFPRLSKKPLYSEFCQYYELVRAAIFADQDMKHSGKF